MNALHPPGQYTTPCSNVLGQNIFQTVRQDGVVVLFLLQLLVVTGEGVKEALCHGTTMSLVVAGEVLASADLVNVHESVFALVRNTDEELKVISRMLGIVENKNLLNLLIEKTTGLQRVTAECNRDAIRVALILQSFLQDNQVDAVTVRETNTVNKAILIVQIVSGISHKYYLSFVSRHFLQGECIKKCFIASQISGLHHWTFRSF